MVGGSRCRMVGLVLVALAASTVVARSAGLTSDDYRYLSSTYGLTEQSDFLQSLTPSERTNLHDAISGMPTKNQQSDAVRDKLYAVYARECQSWAAAHGVGGCGPAKNAAAEPGKELADRVCNDCHRFGTRVAPSFYQLAQQRVWAASDVAVALQHPHRMIPPELSADQRSGIAAYINSLR